MASQKPSSELPVPPELIEQRIFLIRGHKVVVDSDLASLYDVATGALNRAVKRNIDRFPEDFCFQLTEEEMGSLRFQFGISKQRPRREKVLTLRIHGAGRRNAGERPKLAGFSIYNRPRFLN